MPQIELTQGQYAIVDERDYAYLKNFKWFANKKGRTFYACHNFHRKSGNGKLLMHRVILSARPEQEIDHKNGDGLDNRRGNIRFCTRSQNQANRPKPYGISEYKGITPNGKRWQAQINVRGQMHYLGLFKEERDAAVAYNLAAIKFFREFAQINTIKEAQSVG